MGIGSQIALVTFFGVIALVATFALMRSARRMRIQDHLRKRLGSDDRTGSLLKMHEEEKGQMAKLLLESGLGWTMGVFVTRMVLATVIGIGIGVAIGGVPLGLIFGAGGIALFPILARQARTKRLNLCDMQMPQALEIVTLALRAGHPLPKALEIAAAEAPLPIADELQRVVDEHGLGSPIGDVLINMGQRLPESESVQTFLTAVLVLQQTGGNLIAVIDRIVENARARAQYRAKLRALTAEGRASAKMLALMPPAFAVLAASVDPTYAQTLFGTSSGNIVLVITVALWLLGMLWTQRLVKAE